MLRLTIAPSLSDLFRKSSAITINTRPISNNIVPIQKHKATRCTTATELAPLHIIRWNGIRKRMIVAILSKVNSHQEGYTSPIMQPLDHSISI